MKILDGTWNGASIKHDGQIGYILYLSRREQACSNQISTGNLLSTRRSRELAFIPSPQQQ